MPDLLKLYHSLPYPLRVLAASARGYYLRWWRYGPDTERLVEEALDRETPAKKRSSMIGRLLCRNGKRFWGKSYKRLLLMSRLDSLYAKLPVWAQHTALTAYGLYWHRLRFGAGYHQYVQQYQEREVFTKEQWKEWQVEKLKRILPACARYVPYYRETWTDDQKRSAMRGDLTVLPLLEKDPIRSNPRAFLREDMKPIFSREFYTSGSTGTPISSFFTIQEVRRSIALREVRSANWAGVSFQMPRATFSGRLVEPDPNSEGPYYRYNAIERQVYFSAFHLKPDTAQYYVKALNRHKIEWATGYAVSYYLLARFMLEKGIVPPSYLKAIITTSEKLTPDMRDVMEQAYGCRIYEEYSTVENAIFASECEHGRLHVSPDVSVVEILRPDGSPCAPGEVGEVVITTLSRTYQPLIRFRLGDLAAWDDAPCHCGRQMPVLKEIVGRIEDVVIGPDGRQMVRFHGIFTHQSHIVAGQIIQEDLDKIHVLIVPSAGFNSRDVIDIIHRVKQRLGNEVDVTVEPIQEIPRTKAGKFRAVISKLPLNEN